MARTKLTPQDYLGKEPTDVQARMAEWLTETVGYEPTKAKTKQEAFEEGVRLAVALRMDFQRSEENQEVLKERRAEAKAAKAKKAAGKKSKKVKDVEPVEPDEDVDATDEEEQEEEPAPKRRAKKAAPKKAAKKAAPKKAARKPEPDEDEDEGSDDDDDEDVPF